MGTENFHREPLGKLPSLTVVAYPNPSLRWLIFVTASQKAIFESGCLIDLSSKGTYLSSRTTTATRVFMHPAKKGTTFPSPDWSHWAFHSTVESISRTLSPSTEIINSTCRKTSLQIFPAARGGEAERAETCATLARPDFLQVRFVSECLARNSPNPAVSTTYLSQHTSRPKPRKSTCLRKALSILTWSRIRNSAAKHSKMAWRC